MNTEATKTYDAIVVGTGPAGAAVAREVSASGGQVLLLERGDQLPVQGTFMQAMRWLGTPSRGLMMTSSGAPIARGITLGGSSIFYYATAFAPPLDDFQQLGIDLAPFVTRVRSELEIRPLQDRLIGPMARAIMTSARNLGLDWKLLDKFIAQDRCRPGCHRCQYGCPFEAKWTSRMWVREAQDHGAVVRSDSFVEKVIIDGGKAAGVVVRHGRKREQVRAQTVVVSAGGIGTSKILRRTGIREAGRDFFVDPLVAVFGLVDEGSIKDGPRGSMRGREIPMTAGLHFPSDGYVLTDMTVPKPIFAGMTAASGRVWRAGAHRRALTIMVKIRDELGGEIPERGLIRKPLTEADRAKLAAGEARAVEILRHAGAKQIHRGPVIAAHPGGTAKIGEVVDSDLQSRFPGLYVCDCSVIPKPWGLPPTLSLLALGLRLGQRLRS